MLKFLNINKLRWKIITLLVGLHFFGNPSKKLIIVGVTGTNGKTTIATLLYRLFTALGYKVGLIGTNGNIILNEEVPTLNTTPDPKTLNQLLKKMVARGCQYVFMEVSSHAIDQDRIIGLRFAGGIFTNLTHDHLDYHKNFENYFRAKKKFFRNLSREAFALSNIDDGYGTRMLEGIRAKKYTYGFKNDAFFYEHLESKLIGDFNAYNILAIYATAVLLGEDKEKVREVIKSLEPAEGRFQNIKSPNGVTGIVDYAHTPDALENVLDTISKIKNNGKVVTVIGCGGDRDKTKRHIMAKIAFERSDILILTSDNPRSEKPEDILRDMEEGIEDKTKIYSIIDRRSAIEKACGLANSGDFVLLAGKGHEKYQIIGTQKIHFDDMEELKKALN